MRRDTLFPVAVIIGLILAATAAVADEPGNRVELQAQAASNVANDRAAATLQAFHEDDEPEAVTARVNARMRQALDALASPDDLDVTSGTYQVQPVRDREGRLRSWRGRQELTIAGPPDVVADAIGRVQPYLQMQALRLEVSDERRDQAERELTGTAIGQFRERAQYITEAFGYDRYDVLEVTVAGDAGDPPVVPLTRTDAEMAAPAMEAGTTRLRVRVNGRIRMLGPDGLDDDRPNR